MNNIFYCPMYGDLSWRWKGIHSSSSHKAFKTR